MDIKKTLHIICVVALAVSVLSCNKETPASRTAEIGGTVSISVQGLIEDLTPADGVKASAGSVVRVKWETGDAVYVYDGATNLGKLKVTLKEGDDRFAFLTNDGTVNAPQSGTTKLTLIYASGAASAPEVSNGKIIIDLGMQDDADFPFVLYGTLDYESGTVAIEDKFVPFEFATSALKVNCFGLGRGDIAEASLSGVNTKCELSISKDGAPTVVGTTPGTITRSGDGVFSSKTADGRAAFVMGVVTTAEAGEAGEDRKLAVRMDDACGYESAFSGKALSAAASINGIYVFEPAYVEIAALYDGVTTTKLKWAKQNLAASASGKAEWKPAGSSIAVPSGDAGTKVIIGDYFQWGTYKGFCGNSGDSDKGLLIYTAFNCTAYNGTEQTTAFTFKSGKDFSYFNSPHYSGSAYAKYTNTGSSAGDGRNVLESLDDVATIILGGSWRMPTSAEFAAMKAATYWAWDNTDKGYYVFSPDTGHAAGGISSSIPDGMNKAEALLFFPAAGYCEQTSLKSAAILGDYWSSTLSSSSSDNAYSLYIAADKILSSNDYGRFFGRSVRPVSD